MITACRMGQHAANASAALELPESPRGPADLTTMLESAFLQANRQQQDARGGRIHLGRQQVQRRNDRSLK
ncbi:hypothetical protein G6F45_014312 [Rhizopus arrhizus]|nr:hypothetical protein G6F45_014312 [Rhizopus arrhizus]